MDETLFGVPIKTINANIVRQNVSVKRRNRSSKDYVANNTTIFATGYKATTFLQLQEEKHDLFKKKLTCTRLVL